MTSETGAMIVDTLDRMLAETCPPELTRRIVAGGDAAALWATMVELGLPQAMLAEEAGGAGLTLADMGMLATLFGRHLVPVPIADTMVARPLIDAAGVSVGDDPVVLVPASGRVGSRTAPLPLARFARWALTEDEGGALLLCPARAEDGHEATARLRLDLDAGVAVGGALDLLATAAALRAAETAGSIGEMVRLATAHAAERSQFGKPLAAFQAVQQQMAVLAEAHAVAGMAAQIGFVGTHVDRLRAATAKLRVDMAARQAAAIAHAIVGAIGISEEYDLQLHSRRAIDARLSHGSEQEWARRIGERRLADPAPMMLDFVRTHLGAS